MIAHDPLTSSYAADTYKVIPSHVIKALKYLTIFSNVNTTKTFSYTWSSISKVFETTDACCVGATSQLRVTLQLQFCLIYNLITLWKLKYADKPPVW